MRLNKFLKLIRIFLKFQKIDIYKKIDFNIN